MYRRENKGVKEMKKLLKKSKKNFSSHIEQTYIKGIMRFEKEQEHYMTWCKEQGLNKNTPSSVKAFVREFTSEGGYLYDN